VLDRELKTRDLLDSPCLEYVALSVNCGWFVLNAFIEVIHEFMNQSFCPLSNLIFGYRRIFHYAFPPISLYLEGRVPQLLTILKRLFQVTALLGHNLRSPRAAMLAAGTVVFSLRASQQQREWTKAPCAYSPAAGGTGGRNAWRSYEWLR
jgi:hypothetical protein